MLAVERQEMMSEQENIARMTSSMEKMRELLREHGSDWVRTVDGILQAWLETETPEERSLVVRQLSRIHGNLGLSDEYFEKDGQILREETQKLSALQREVYDLVVYFVR